MVAGLLGCKHTGGQLLGNPGVIPGDLADTSPADQISPAVPHIGDQPLLAMQHGGDEGRAHPRLPLVQKRLFPDNGISFLDGTRQAASQVPVGIAVVGLEQRGDGLLAGHLAGRVPAHAISHGEEPPLALEQSLIHPHGVRCAQGILVQLSRLTGVSSCARDHLRLFCHLLYLSVPVPRPRKHQHLTRSFTVSATSDLVVGSSHRV